MKKNIKLLFSSIILSSTISLNSCIFLGSISLLDLLNNATSNNNTQERINGNVTYNTPEYDSSFTKENMNKDNIGLGFGQRYLPSTGNSKILVIPVQFSDGNKFSSYQIAIMKNTFFGEASDTGWESLTSFYETSSYGKLKLSGEITDPITAKYSLAEIKNAFSNDNNYKYTNYSNEILKSAVKSVSNSVNLSDYDTNNDGYVDGVWLIYNESTYNGGYGGYNSYTTGNELFWAYTYWLNSDDTFSDKKLNVYAWASYNFLYNSSYYNSKISNKTKTGDAHTLIHETGHMLGLDDYYCVDSNESPVAKIDMMDNNVIDHMAYSKYALGWIKPTIINSDLLSNYNYTITINSLVETGDSYILPIYKDNTIKYNDTPFDEYLILETYTPTSLNKQDSQTKYDNVKAPNTVGLRVYHVNARIGKIVIENEQLVWDKKSYDKLPINNDDYSAYYYLYANTNSYSYGTLIDDSNSSFYRTRLVSLLPKCSSFSSYCLDSNYLYTTNDSFMLSGGSYTNFVFDNGSKPQYGFKVSTTDSNSVTLTFESL